MGTRVAMIEWFYGQTQTPKKAKKITNFPGDKREIGTLLDVVGKWGDGCGFNNLCIETFSQSATLAQW